MLKANVWIEIVANMVKSLPIEKDLEYIKEQIIEDFKKISAMVKTAPDLYNHVGCLLSEEFCKSVHAAPITNLDVSADPVIDGEQLDAIATAELSIANHATVLLDEATYPSTAIVDAATGEATIPTPTVIADPAIVAAEEAVMMDPGIDMSASEMVPKFDSDLEQQLAAAKASAAETFKAVYGSA